MHLLDRDHTCECRSSVREFLLTTAVSDWMLTCADAYVRVWRLELARRLLLLPVGYPQIQRKVIAIVTKRRRIRLRWIPKVESLVEAPWTLTISDDDGGIAIAQGSI